MSESDRRIDRRQILVGMGLTGLALAAWPVRWLLATEPNDVDIAADRIVRLFDDGEGLRRLDHHYLRSSQQQMLPEDLVADIIPPSTDHRTFAAASDEEARRLLTDLVDHDFVSGRITPVEGWMLSHTEMRIAALATLRGA